MESNTTEAETQQRIQKMKAVEEMYTLIPLKQIIMDHQNRRSYGSIDGTTINPLSLSFIYEKYGAWGILPFVDMLSKNAEEMEREVQWMTKNHMEKAELPGYNPAEGEHGLVLAELMLKARRSLEDEKRL